MDTFSIPFLIRKMKVNEEINNLECDKNDSQNPEVNNHKMSR